MAACGPLIAQDLGACGAGRPIGAHSSVQASRERSARSGSGNTILARATLTRQFVEKERRERTAANAGAERFQLRGARLAIELKNAELHACRTVLSNASSCHGAPTSTASCTGACPSL